MHTFTPSVNGRTDAYAVLVRLPDRSRHVTIKGFFRAIERVERISRTASCPACGHHWIARSHQLPGKCPRCRTDLYALRVVAAQQLAEQQRLRAEELSNEPPWKKNTRLGIRVMKLVVPLGFVTWCMSNASTHTSSAQQADPPTAEVAPAPSMVATATAVTVPKRTHSKTKGGRHGDGGGGVDPGF